MSIASLQAVPEDMMDNMGSSLELIKLMDSALSHHNLALDSEVPKTG